MKGTTRGNKGRVGGRSGGCKVGGVTVAGRTDEGQMRDKVPRDSQISLAVSLGETRCHVLEWDPLLVECSSLYGPSPLPSEE